MPKGIVYITTTASPGIIKIGQTASDRFEKRMGQLEGTGYNNVTGLKRRYAIEVEDYTDKERLLHDVFAHCRVGNSELFAADVDLVVQLLSSFEGTQVYPPTESKEDVFGNATDQRNAKQLPDGDYVFSRKIAAWNNRLVTGRMNAKGGVLTVLRGSVLCPVKGVGYSVKTAERMRAEAVIVNDVLQNDIVASSPSAAAAFLIYANSNGWDDWKDEKGEPIRKYRLKDSSDD